jgi:hypothetical protein
MKTLPVMKTRFLLFAAVAGALCAQSAVDVPFHAAATECNESLALPFGYEAFRTQLLVDPAAIAPNGAVLTSLRFRVDRYALPRAASVLSSVTVRLSHTSQTLAGVATTFANNVTNPPLVVYQGPLALPGYTDRTAGALPWDIHIPFNGAFQYTASQGQLLIDIEGNGPMPPNPAGPTPTCFVDAAEPGGSATHFGEMGTSATNEPLQLTATTQGDLEPLRISPGNPIDFVAQTGFVPRPAWLALGFAALPTPVDLTPIGAPGNAAYIAADVFLPLPWTSTFMGHASTVTLTLPGSPSVLGTLLYGQSLLLDDAANPLGLQLSRGVEVRVGDANEVSYVRQVDAVGSGAATGTLVNLGSFVQPRFASAAFRLEGAFF